MQLEFQPAGSHMKFAGKDDQDHFGAGMSLFDNLDRMSDEGFASKASGSSTGSAAFGWSKPQQPAAASATSSGRPNQFSEVARTTASLRRKSSVSRADPETMRALRQLKQRVGELQQQGSQAGSTSRSRASARLASQRSSVRSAAASQQSAAAVSQRSSLRSSQRPARARSSLAATRPPPQRLGPSASAISLFGPMVPPPPPFKKQKSALNPSGSPRHLVWGQKLTARWAVRLCACRPCNTRWRAPIRVFAVLARVVSLLAKLHSPWTHCQFCPFPCGATYMYRSVGELHTDGTTNESGSQQQPHFAAGIRQRVRPPAPAFPPPTVHHIVLTSPPLAQHIGLHLQSWRRGWQARSSHPCAIRPRLA